MEKFDLFGEEFWRGTDEECRELWRKHPQDRWRIFSEEEVTRYLLAEPETVQRVIEEKKRKPGTVRI